VAYATVDELAAALRITVTAANEASLQACLDAAATEIDAAMDRVDDLDPDDALANRVNVLRGVEWFKGQDAAFGVIGMSETGALRAPTDGFARHYVTLLPNKQKFGVA
jgi:hypothetical protein